MPLAPGTRIGQLEIIERIGAGGMGEVFRAHDPALRRDVAVKILPPLFLNDPERRQRFAREAQALAAMSHHHIAQVYGVAESTAGPAILMELVPGETLRHIIGGRPLPPRDAVGYARQIALALDAAHEKGIVHRDLKPANIAITADGTVKVLDFGLAKILADAAVDVATQIASGETREGEVVGTPAYMSPEQVRGQAVDRRSDIWSFGCVLFEMLTGRQPFTRPSASDTVAGILEHDPEWALLPPSTPLPLRHLLRRCLEKDRRLRLRDIGDALPELAEGSSDSLIAAAASAPGLRTPRVPVYGLAALAAALAVTAFWLWSRPVPGQTTEAQTVRFSMPPPAGMRFGSSTPTVETTTLAFSPDGTRLAFIASGTDGVSRVLIRRLDAEEVRPVAGSEHAHSTFWHPDGRSLAFFAAGKLKRIDPGGGAAVLICDVPTGSGLNGAWGSNGDVLFASVSGEGIYRVPANGGVPTLVVPKTAERPRVGWPHFLPDGKRFLYSWLGSNLGGGIVLVEADGRQRQLVEARSRAQFVQPDILLSVREGTLLAHRVDLAGARIVGDPVPVLARINYSSATGWSEFAASAHGTLAVRTETDDAALTLIRRDGSVEREVGERGQYLTVRASPDESRILFARWRPELGTFAVWRMGLDRYAATRVTTAPGMETGEVWVPGMREIVISVSDGTVPNMHVRDLASGVDRPLAPSDQFQLATDVSPARQVVYQQRTAGGTWNLMQLSLDDPSSPKPLMVTGNSETGLRFAPRGDRIAWQSNESGRWEVYVAPFPFKGDKIQVSTEGGGAPRWQRDGQALYFVSGQRLMRVAIDQQGRPAQPQLMFATSRWQDYDVLDAGRRFIAIVIRSAASEQPLTVVLNARRLMEGRTAEP